MGTKQRAMKYQNSSGSFNFTRYRIHNDIKGTLAEYMGEVATKGKGYSGSGKLTDRHEIIQQKLNEFGNRIYASDDEKRTALQELDHVSEVLSMTLYRNSSMNHKYADLLQGTKKKIASIRESLRIPQKSSLEETIVSSPPVYEEPILLRTITSTKISDYFPQEIVSQRFVQLDESLRIHRESSELAPVQRELQEKWELLNKSYQRALQAGKITRPLATQYDVGIALLAFSGKTREEHAAMYDLRKINNSQVNPNKSTQKRKPVLRLAGAAAGLLLALGGLISKNSYHSKAFIKHDSTIPGTPLPSGRVDYHNAGFPKERLSLK